MIDIFQNRNINRLLWSNFFNAIGTQIFNIALLVYAAQQSYATLAITLVTWSNFIPELFAPVQGYHADKVSNKSVLIWKIHLIQSIIFLIYAMALLHQLSILAFIVLLSLGIVSDYFGGMTLYLSQPLAKHFLDDNLIRQFVSFNSTLSRVISIAGQSIGLLLLSTFHHNYAVLALINAFTFIIAALFIRKIPTYKFNAKAPTSENKQANFLTSFVAAFKILKREKFVGIVLVLAVVNAFLDALGLLINIGLHNFPQLQFQNYSLSILIINIVSSFAAIFGSFIIIPFLERQSFFQLNFLVLLLMIIQLSNFVTLNNFLVLITTKFLATLLIAYQGPKISDIFLKHFPIEQLGIISGVLNFILTAGGPVALLLNTVIANISSTVAAVKVTLMILVLSLMILIFNRKRVQ